MVTRIFALLLLLPVLALVACTDDDPTAGPAAEPGVISGEIDPGTGGFEIVLQTAGYPDGPYEGPFVLRGFNLRWVEELQALAVDLAITNAGVESHPMPVGLTFTDLFPADVRVLDADNGIEGPGAAIVFGFANDDLLWTPGETSFPRTVHFAVARGLAVAFHARVDIGGGPLTGRIAGLVWQDYDGDGSPGPGEPGLPGVPVLLRSAEPFDGHSAPVPPTDFLRFAVSDSAGRYLFAQLPADFYSVRVEPGIPLMPTTPTELHVLLAEVDGTVTNYDHADFGFQPYSGEVIEVPSSADATVRADLASRTNDNYGCDPHVAVGSGRDGTPDLIRGLVQFDVPVPIHAMPLMRATLVMHIETFRDGFGQVYELALHEVVEGDSLTPWIEGNGSELVDFGWGCEWVDPAFGVAWFGAGDGGDANNQTQPPFAPEPLATAMVAQDSMRPGSDVTWDVTEIVRDWQAGSRPNHGLFIRDVLATGDFKSIWLISREGEDQGIGRGPRLILEYGAPPVKQGG